MPNTIKHDIPTRMLVIYLYNFCRPDKRGSHGLIPCRVIEKITGVPSSTVNKIGMGEL